MTDSLTPARRSANMAAIRGRDTGPELAVRRVLRAHGVGYRLHVAGLPGRPDIVMQGRRTVIFVHGCFWHRHEGCRFAYTPKSRVDFWRKKFADNVARDHKNKTRLLDGGWRVHWECETTDATVLEKRIAGLLQRGSDESGSKGQGRTERHRAQGSSPAKRQAAARP